MGARRVNAVHAASWTIHCSLSSSLGAAQPAWHSQHTSAVHSPQVFGSSPDETAFFRILLNRERAGEAMLMIQPSLVSYSVDQGAEPSPVLLDVQSILPDR